MLGRNGSTLAALLMACAPGVAQEISHPDGDGTIVVRGDVHPLAAQQITQSVDPNQVQSGISVACGSGGVTTDNGLWRLFDLDADHGLVGGFCVESVDYAVETATGPQNLTVNVYCLDEGLPFVLASLTLAGSHTAPQPDAQLEFFNIEASGCCDSATQDMAVELLSEDCLETGTCVNLFLGSNFAGQTAPPYITAPDCGIVDPYYDGFVLKGHLVMVVNGQDESGEDGGGDGGAGGDGGGVPATTAAGAALGVLLLLAAAAHFLRGAAGG